MSLSKDNTKLIKSMVVECLLEGDNKVTKNISSSIIIFKEFLKKKNISCRVNFLQPDITKKYQDFGSLTVSVDISVGRSKNMSIKSLVSYIKKLAQKTNILRYFSFVGPGVSGNILDLEFDLKNKYITFYTNEKEEFPVDFNRFEGERYYLPKESKLL